MPERVVAAVSEFTPAPRMLLPGAKMSTQWPSLEKYERASLEVVDPTVTASPAEAGEYLHASSLELPAATTTSTLDACALATALFTADE